MTKSTWEIVKKTDREVRTGWYSDGDSLIYLDMGEDTVLIFNDDGIHIESFDYSDFEDYDRVDHGNVKVVW